MADGEHRGRKLFTRAHTKKELPQITVPVECLREQKYNPTREMHVEEIQKTHICERTA